MITNAKSNIIVIFGKDIKYTTSIFFFFEKKAMLKFSVNSIRFHVSQKSL